MDWANFRDCNDFREAALKEVSILFYEYFHGDNGAGLEIL